MKIKLIKDIHFGARVRKAGMELEVDAEFGAELIESRQAENIIVKHKTKKK